MKPIIIVNISGGCVTSVVSDTPIEATVIVRDCDDIRDGDPDPALNLSVDAFEYQLW